MMKKVVSKQGIFHQLETCLETGGSPNKSVPVTLGLRNQQSQAAQAKMMLCHHPQVSNI